MDDLLERFCAMASNVATFGNPYGTLLMPLKFLGFVAFRLKDVCLRFPLNFFFNKKNRVCFDLVINLDYF